MNPKAISQSDSHQGFALITGASAGLGEEFARQLAAMRKSLILVARREERLQSIAASLRKQHDIQVEIITADLSVPHAAEDIAKHLSGYTVVVTKSTVPVGTGRDVAGIIAKTNPDAKFDIASNPEFLREGAAIADFMRPDRVVVGAETDAARDVMRALYRPLFLIETPILFTNLETSELIKYASNAFLAVKISYINQMADLCEKVGANVHDVAKGMGLDKRIGNKFLHPGPGYGGSCFPKDTLVILLGRIFAVSDTYFFNNLIFL